MSRTKSAAHAGFACCLLLFLPLAANGGAKVNVGKDVPAADRVSIDRISHAGLNKLLAKYVNDDGNVNYTAWKASAADHRALHVYLQHLSSADRSKPATRAARLAFWINAYNAVTIAGILREYPTTSIRNHTARVFGYNIWHDLLLKVDGADYSLDTIEHKILRTMDEPRIHFAIVCASKSCPKLRNEAYTADAVDEQLAANTKDFFSRESNFRYDARSNTMYLSSILSWFAEDFGESKAARLRTISPWLPTVAARRAAAAGDAGVSYLSYDWGLNDQK